MRRRKPIAEPAKASSLQNPPADRHGRLQSSGAGGIQADSDYNPTHRLGQDAVARSPRHAWLLLAAIVLEAAWLAMLLVMVLCRW